MVKFKVVETTTVTEDSLETILNEWSSKGWTLDGMQFAMKETVKRPTMAFVFFTMEAPDGAEGSDGAKGTDSQD